MVISGLAVCVCVFYIKINIFSNKHCGNFSVDSFANIAHNKLQHNQIPFPNAAVASFIYQIIQTNLGTFTTKITQKGYRLNRC